MKVCITEKPSVARDIAAILGASDRHDGYFEGNGWQVTWTFGHLCCLKEPDDYDPNWKRWSLAALPMIPKKFGIKLINEKGSKHQFHVIEALVKNADEVINCGDAGQEGELIQRWVMQKARVKCPVRRLWISSLTDEAIREGFKNLTPQDNFQNLYFAGLSRAIGDWVLGMNATRLYSLKYGSPGNVLSVGRVQTPTLALIVQRHHEIVNFVPKDTWELRTIYRDTTFTATIPRFETEAAGQTILNQIAPLPFTITGITNKEGREAPPKLFDLTSLQVEANKKWGWTADQTLKLIQSLYEKKVTTYPRVDTTYLSEDLHPKVPGILQKMTPYAPQTASILAAPIPKTKRIFDNAKVTDHHAIIPTGESPTILIGDERKLYHLIAMRFIAAFYPDCHFTQTTVTGQAGNVNFKTTGKVITDPGWRALFASEQSTENENNAEADTDDNASRVLPIFTPGETGPHKPALVKRTSQPPKPYTEGTLLRAMESAGKTVDDEALREAMKENGIGRPSTRAAIIETLFRRRYIRRERKTIVPTQAGIDLIATINEELLKSAKLTGIWENKLRRIERGEYSAAEFIAELKQLISTIVLNVMSDASGRRIVTEQEVKAKSGRRNSSKAKSSSTPSSPATSSNSGTPKPTRKRYKSVEEIPCPICGQGHILRGHTAYGCSRYREGCPLRLDFTQYPADLTPGRLATKIVKLNKQ